MLTTGPLMAVQIARKARIVFKNEGRSRDQFESEILVAALAFFWVA